MGRRKIEIKYIENRITRQITFSKRQVGIFRKADALARLCNVEVAVLINSPFGQPYVFGSQCFNSVVGHFQNPYPKKSSFSLKHSKILKRQAKLDSLIEELKQHKEYERVLKKRQEETLKNYDMKETKNLKLERLTAIKEKLQAARDNMKRKYMEMEASSSLMILGN